MHKCSLVAWYAQAWGEGLASLCILLLPGRHLVVYRQARAEGLMTVCVCVCVCVCICVGVFRFHSQMFVLPRTGLQLISRAKTLCPSSLSSSTMCRVSCNICSSKWLTLMHVCH